MAQLAPCSRSILKSRDESDQFSTSRPIVLRQHDQLGEFSTRSNRYCISRTVGLFGGLRAIIHARYTLIKRRQIRAQAKAGCAPATRSRPHGAGGPELACGSPPLPCRPFDHRAGLRACVLRHIRARALSRPWARTPHERQWGAHRARFCFPCAARTRCSVFFLAIRPPSPSGGRSKTP